MPKDYVLCRECGEEHNRYRKHICDPKILEQLAQEERDDQDVRDNEED